MSDHWILDGHQVVPADLMTWAKWFGSANRSVARTEITKDASCDPAFFIH